jgi:transposase
MEVLVHCCCGLDVHKATIVACLLTGTPHQKPHKEIHTFGTMTRDLIALRDWLLEHGCTHVGMESTGVYWKPIYAILEDHVDVTIGNAHHIKNVPGRKTDVKDAEWIADLLRHGLINKSFVPNQPIRELRDLLRYRRKVVEARSAERNRVIKLLDQANIKLSSIATDVFGVSGMLMIKALIAGEAKPDEMAQLAKGRMRTKIGQLEHALEGTIEEHHRFLLGKQVRRLEQMDTDLEHVEQRIEQQLVPFATQRALLMQIPGVDRVVAAVLIAELGVDMRVFGSAGRAAAWAGVAPGNYESGGKRRPGATRKGNPFLTTALVEAAQAAASAKGTYLRDKFHRLKARRGYKRALVAIAHKILISAYHMLATGADYQELGEAYLDRMNSKRVATHLIRRLERLGYDVTARAPAA